MPTLQEQVRRIATSNASRTQRLEDLVYLLGLPVAEALNALDIYKPVRKVRTPEEVTFGVEIECFDIIKGAFAGAACASGVQTRIEGYNHTDNEVYYKLVGDCSIMGANSCEVVSPILKGKKGLESLRTICDLLCNMGANVNRSCGLHVHLDASKMTIEHWRNLYINYARLEGVIDSFMPASRRANNNSYCRSIALQPRLEATILHCNSVREIKDFFCSRYFKINVESFDRHGTVEFRQHSGTVDFEKISNWVNFLQKLLAYSKNHTVENGVTLDTIPFLTKTEKKYFQKRITTLAA